MDEPRPCEIESTRLRGVTEAKLTLPGELFQPVARITGAAAGLGSLGMAEIVKTFQPALGGRGGSIGQRSRQTTLKIDYFGNLLFAEDIPKLERWTLQWLFFGGKRTERVYGQIHSAI